MSRRAREQFISEVLEQLPPEEMVRFLQNRLIDALGSVFEGDRDVLTFAAEAAKSGKSVEEIHQFSSRFAEGRLIPKERVGFFLRVGLSTISGLGKVDKEYLFEAPYGVWEFLERSSFPDETIASYFEKHEGEE